MWYTVPNCVSRHYSDEELALLLPQRIPKHVAIIPDGHRRWLKRTEGNLRSGYGTGLLLGEKIIEAASELGIGTLTFYAFSTENWRRDSEEVDLVLEVFISHLRDYTEQMVTMGVRFATIGDLSVFPDFFRCSLEETQKATAQGTGITLVVALNYGARDEICRAFRSLIEAYDHGQVSKEKLSEEVIGTYLDTAPYGDPDLLIRTSGEQRVSNFLLWQLAYTELYLTPVLWPDFTTKELFRAVQAFQARNRRWGK